MILLRYLGEMLESAFNPLFFQKAVQKSALRAFGYYLFFTTVFTLAVCGVGTWRLSQLWNPALNQLPGIIPAFEIRLDQGLFSTTLPQPIVLGDEEFALLVDTSPTTQIDLSTYKSAALILPTKVIVKKNAFESQEYNLSILPDFSLTTAEAIQWLRGYKNPILWGLFAIMSLVVIPTFWMFLIPAIMIFMLVMMIPARLIRSNLSYSQLLSIGFYAVTFPTFLQTYFLFEGQSGGIVMRWVYVVWCFVGIIAARTLGKTIEKPQVPTPPV